MDVDRVLVNAALSRVKAKDTDDHAALAGTRALVEKTVADYKAGCEPGGGRKGGARRLLLARRCHAALRSFVYGGVAIAHALKAAEQDVQ